MPTTKPLPISSDALPDQSVTRDKLGKGAIVSAILGVSNQAFTDGLLQFSDIWLDIINASPENVAQSTMPLSGRMKKLYLNILLNTLSSNMIFTLRKNGVDTADVITVLTTDTGIKSYDLTTSFDAGDLLSWKQVGDGAANSLSATPSLIIEYDG